MPKYQVSARLTVSVSFVIEAEDEWELESKLEKVVAVVLVGNGSTTGMVGLEGLTDQESVDFMTDDCYPTDIDFEQIEAKKR
jgi:hypothetical protein